MGRREQGREGEGANMVTDVIWLSHCLHYYGSFFFLFGRVSLYFKIAINETFDLRKPKDKARVDPSNLKHKPGKLEEYIMDFTALASRAGYILAGDAENTILSQIFLEHLNPQLRERIETQKEPPEKIKDIISDARKFDKSYYK